ncbi:MAG: (Fe-S)-binding protein, partial [Syntrophaceae bacterium]|nr:(Fe-S)-binding protein [Syntrophaceae bacterium]
MDQERLKNFSQEVYQCTLCGHCEVVCPVNIHSKEIRIALRENMVKGDLQPALQGPILENLQQGRNVTYPTNHDRLLWLQNMPKIFRHCTHKTHAEVVYFVGCVASFFPATYSIPQAMLILLEKAKVDYGILGPEEWCCGWPLIGMGMEEKVDEFAKHNIEAVKAMGATTLICGCPSCYHVWKNLYPRFSSEKEFPFEIIHSADYFLELLKEERIPLHALEATVTYHDPCDLGRASGIYEPPREIIRMVSGINFVEMRHHKQHATCCGGGGDLEMFFPKITKDIVNLKVKEIEETRAEVVLSACQQCKRTIALNAKKMKKKFRVLDLLEFILILADPMRALTFENLLQKTSSSEQG